MAKIIISGGQATGSGHTKYMSMAKGESKYIDDKILFTERESNLAEHQAKKIIKGKDESKEQSFIKLVFSLEEKNFKRLGESQKERLLTMQEIVRKSLGSLWKELGVKDVDWAAATHLNTGHPHTHILFNTSAVNIKTGKEKKIPKIPRSWFWRENKDNSKLAKLFEAPLAAHSAATPPIYITTKQAAEEVFLPIREINSERIEKTLNHLSEVNGIAPHWIEQLTNNGSLYVSRQGALTFVRRDTKGYATGYVYENGYQPEETKGFFYVGDPHTAKHFIIAETPKEVMAILELTGHRDLSEVCVVASDKKNIPVALKNHLKEISQEKPVRVIWALGLNRNGVQEAGNFNELQNELSKERAADAPVLEFFSWQPKAEFGKTWNSQIQARNMPGEINGITKKILALNVPEREQLDEQETQNYYEQAASSFGKVRIVNEGKEFIVLNEDETKTTIEYGRYISVADENQTGESGYRITSVDGAAIEDANGKSIAAFTEEMNVVAEIKNLFGEKVELDILTALNETTGAAVETVENDNPVSETEIPFQEDSDQIIRDLPVKQLSAREVTEQLKEIPLEDVMPTLGLSLTYDRERREYVYRDNGTMNKIKVKGDLFCDRYSDNRGGKNAINLVMQIRGTDFADARQHLIDIFGTSFIPVRTPDKIVLRNEAERPRMPFIMPERNDQRLPGIFDYLTVERGLDAGLVTAQIDEGHIFANGFGSSTFVYRNEDGMIKGAAWRATIGNKRGDYAGTDKTDSWFYLGDIKTAKRFVIVEAPIEALSYAQLHPEADLKTTAIVSTSMASVPAGLINLLEQNGGAESELILAYNNDRGGNRGVEFVLEKTGRYVLLDHKDHHLNGLIETTEFSGKIMRDVPVLEDWNEDVKAQRETEFYETAAPDAGEEIDSVSRPEILPRSEFVTLENIEIGFMEGWHTDENNQPRIFPVVFESISEFNDYIKREKRDDTTYKTDVRATLASGTILQQTFTIGEDLPDTLTGLLDRQIDMFEQMKSLPAFADQMEEVSAEIGSYKFIRNAVETIFLRELKANDSEDLTDEIESPENNLTEFSPEMIRTMKVSVPLHFKEIGKAEIFLAREDENEPFFSVGYRIRIGADTIEKIPAPGDEKFDQGKQSLSNAYDQARSALETYWKEKGANRFTLDATQINPDEQKYTAYLLNKLESNARGFSVRSFDKSFAIIPEFSETEINVLRRWKDRTSRDDYFKIEDVFYRETENARIYQNLMYKFAGAGLLDVRQERSELMVRGGNPLTREALSYLKSDVVESIALSAAEARRFDLLDAKKEYATALAGSISDIDREYFERQYELVRDELEELEIIRDKQPAFAEPSAIQWHPDTVEINLGIDPGADYRLLKENPLKGIYDRQAHVVHIEFDKTYQKDVEYAAGIAFKYRDRLVTVMDTEAAELRVNFRIENGKSTGKNKSYTLAGLIGEDILSEKNFERLIAVARTRQEIKAALENEAMNLDYRAAYAPDLIYPEADSYRINSRYSEGDYILVNGEKNKYVSQPVTLFKQKVEEVEGQKVYSLDDARTESFTALSEAVAHIKVNEESYKLAQAALESAAAAEQNAAQIIENTQETSIETIDKAAAAAVIASDPPTAALQSKPLPAKPTTRDIEENLTTLINAKFSEKNYDFSVYVRASEDENGAFDLFYNGNRQNHSFPQYRLYAPLPEFDEWSALKNMYDPAKAGYTREFEITDKSFINETELAKFTSRRIIKDERLKQTAKQLIPTVLPSPEQQGRIEKRIARLLLAHNLGEAAASRGELFVRLENAPYMDLYIEKAPNSNLLRLTHYYEQNGDTMHDGEINFRLNDGILKLNQVAVALYGTPKYVYDRSFAEMFSSNLIKQNFEKAVPHRRVETSEVPVETPRKETPENSETAPEFQVSSEFESVREIITSLPISGETKNPHHLTAAIGEGAEMPVIEVINPVQTRLWLPNDFWNGAANIKNRMIADGLQETGRTGIIFADVAPDDLRQIHFEALEQLGLEGEFTDDQIVSQGEVTQLFADALQLQSELDSIFAGKSLHNRWAVIAETGSHTLEIQLRQANGEPNGFPAFALYKTENGENWQIAVGREIPQTRDQPADFEFEEAAELRFKYEEAVGRLSDILMEETNISKNRIAPEFRTPFGAETEPAGVKTGTIALADEIREILHSGEAVGNNVVFNKIAERNFGGSRAAGTFDARDAYDALELGVNLYLLDRSTATDFAANPAGTLRELRELLHRLPTQSDRTDEQNLFQQFSTPPTMSFAAFIAAGARPDDVVLEPSAGCAGLAVWTKMRGIETRVNEISDRRAGILKILGFTDITRKDAQFLNDTLDQNIKPTLVLMNPPFSATGGRTRNRTKYGAEHITDALQRLAPGGRLVAIVGEGMAFGKPMFTNWWAEVLNKYTVRANIGIPGEEYGKYGTTFGNQMLVIDKTGATPGATMQEQLARVVKGDRTNLEVILPELESIAATRPDFNKFGSFELDIKEEVQRVNLLLPETVDLSPMESRWFSEYQNKLLIAGFETVALSEKVVAIKTMPENIDLNKVRENFMDQLASLGNAAAKADNTDQPLLQNNSVDSKESRAESATIQTNEIPTDQIINNKVYDIGAGSLGNGIVWWNRAEEKNGEYTYLAQVEDSGKISLHDDNLPEDTLKDIQNTSLRLTGNHAARLIGTESAKNIGLKGYRFAQGILSDDVSASIEPNLLSSADVRRLRDANITIEKISPVPVADQKEAEGFAEKIFEPETYDILKSKGYEFTPGALSNNSREVLIRSGAKDAAARLLEAGVNLKPTQKTYDLAREEAAGAIIGKIERLESRGYRIIFGEPNESLKSELIGILSGGYAARFIEKGLTVEPITFDRVERQDFIKRADLKANPDKIYLFGDNTRGWGYGGQAAELRGEVNAHGIPTKIFPNNTPGAFFDDEDLIDNKNVIGEAIGKLAKFSPDRVLIVPTAGLGTGLADLEKRAPETFAYLQKRLLELGINDDNPKVQFELEDAKSEEIAAAARNVGSTQESVESQMSLLLDLIPLEERELEIITPLEDINLSKAGVIRLNGIAGFSQRNGVDVEMDAIWEEAQIASLVLTGATEAQTTAILSQLAEIRGIVKLKIDGREFTLSPANDMSSEDILTALYSAPDSETFSVSETETVSETNGGSIERAGNLIDQSITLTSVMTRRIKEMNLINAGELILNPDNTSEFYPQTALVYTLGDETISVGTVALLPNGDFNYQAAESEIAAVNLTREQMFETVCEDIEAAQSAAQLRGNRQHTTNEIIAVIKTPYEELKTELETLNAQVEGIEDIYFNVRVDEENNGKFHHRLEVRQHLPGQITDGEGELLGEIALVIDRYEYDILGDTDTVYTVEDLSEGVISAIGRVNENRRIAAENRLLSFKDEYSKLQTTLGKMFSESGRGEITTEKIITLSENGKSIIHRLDVYLLGETSESADTLIGTIQKGSDYYTFEIGDAAGEEVYRAADVADGVIREIMRQYDKTDMPSQEIVTETVAAVPIDMEAYERATAENLAFDANDADNLPPEDVRADYFRETLAIAEAAKVLQQQTSAKVFLTKKAELDHKKSLGKLEFDKSDLAFRLAQTGDYFGAASESYLRDKLETIGISINGEYEVTFKNKNESGILPETASRINDQRAETSRPEISEQGTTAKIKDFVSTEDITVKSASLSAETEERNFSGLQNIKNTGEHNEYHTGSAVGINPANNSRNGRIQPGLFERANQPDELHAYGRGNADISFDEYRREQSDAAAQGNQPETSLSSDHAEIVSPPNAGEQNGDNHGDSGEFAAGGINAGAAERAAVKPEIITADALGIGTNTEKRTRIDNLGVVEYKPAKLTGGVEHPADIVESASMAAVVPPDIKYTPKLDRRIIDDGLLSSLQLETVIYAGQRHEIKLGDGSRAGYFIGDGTGVGKGRELAGIALDNWNQGRHRILWLSINYDLVPSTERDMKGLGATEVPLHSLNKYSVHGNLEEQVGDGLLFASYATLTGKGKDGKTRFDQIREWLGKDGVIMFDEGHLAKNAVSFGQAQASQRGEAVVDLQIGEKSNPNWRFVYSSATGATELRNMAYMQRLGLWGTGSGFPGGFIEFHNTIDRGGIGAMEMVARDMKAAGMYCSRSLSMRGVDYRALHHELSPDQKNIYNIAARAWAEVARSFDDSLKMTNADGRAKGMAYARLYSGQQMFFRQLMTAMKVPSLVQETERVLKEGSTYIDEKTGEQKTIPAQIVIGVIGTGEARTKEQVSKALQFGLDLDTLDFSPKQILLNVVEAAYPVNRYTEELDPSSGKTIKVPILDEDGRAVQSQEAIRLRDELLSELEENVKLPDNPLDQIVNYFGESAVAEITGRDKRIILDPETNERRYVKRARSGVAMDKASQDEMNAFQAGRKRIAIISQSASTGISLHSELKPLLENYLALGKINEEQAANIQKYWDENKDTEGTLKLVDEAGIEVFRRIHITLETAWSADTQMQTFGRTHRSNELLPPEYVLMSTDLGGEKRFLATIAKRLGSLGALTKGDREQAGGGNLLDYDFENKYGMEAAKKIVTMLRDGKPHLLTLLPPDPETGIERGGLDLLYTMGIAKRDGNSYVVPDKTLEDLEVSKFLNRVLMLDVDTQNAVFAAFVEEMEVIITHDKELGLFDEGVKDIKGENIRLAQEAKVVSTEKTTGAETLYYKISADTPTAPVSLQEIEERNKVVRINGLELNTERNRGVFYQQKNSKNIIYTEFASTRADAATGALVRHYKFARPAGWQSTLLTEKDLLDKYVPVHLEEHREFGEDDVREVRQWWNKEFDETPPSRVQDYHLIAGAVLPVWQRLASTNEKGDQMSLKTVRIETEDGERIVGVEIPARHINRVLRDLGVQQSFKTPEEIFDAVLDTKETINLVGSVQLRPTFLKKNPAIEIMNLSQFQRNEFQNFGAQKEIINFNDKYFVPTDKTKGIEVLEKILERYPAVAKTEESKQTAALGAEADKTPSLGERIAAAAELLANGLKTPNLAEISENSRGFYAEAKQLRDKPLSNYWHLMNAEANEKGQISINPAAFEFMRVAYRQTFREDVKNFEGLFTNADNTDRFLQTLDHMEENCGIYCDSITALTKTIAAARNSREDKALIFLTNDRPSTKMHEEGHAVSESASYGKNLIERHARFEELTNTEAYIIAKPILAAKYHTQDDGLLVEETMMYITSGDGEKIGLLPEETADFGVLWYKSFAEKNGDVSILKFKEMTDESQRIRDRAYREIQAERYRQERAGRTNAGSGERNEQRPALRDDEEWREFAGGTGEFEQEAGQNIESSSTIRYKTSDESTATEETGDILEDYAISTPEGNNVETLAVYVEKYPAAAEDLLDFAADRDLINDVRYEEMTLEQMTDSSEARLDMYRREVYRINAEKAAVPPPAAAPVLLYKTAAETSTRELGGDAIFNEFQSIFEQAGMERILEAEKVSASFQTLGASPAKYQLTVEDDAISFGKITAAGQNSPGEKIQGVTFAAGSAGNYQYAGSFACDLKDDAVTHDFDQAAAFETVTAWNNDGLGENIIVTQFDAADDENMTAGIEAANQANLEIYLSRQKGFELIGEIAVRAAAFDAAEFRRASAEQKLTVTARIAGQEITREISQNELLRERQAIARADVAAMKKTGILGMIGEDENKPLAAVERREYARAVWKAERKQQPLVEALDAMIIKEVAGLDAITLAAERKLSQEKARTALMAKHTSGEKSAGIKATVMPEIIWIEQNKAVRRGDAETFSRLEEVHRQSGLPRPNDVFARLKAMEAIADSRDRQARADLTKWAAGNNFGDEKVLVTLKGEYEKLLITNWQVVSKGNENNPADTDGREEVSSADAETAYEKAAKNSSDYASRAAALRKGANRSALQPLMNKINPLSPIQGTLSWITSPKDTLNAHFNPVEIIKNDPGVQIIRAVAGFIDRRSKAAELDKLARETRAAADALREQFNEKLAAGQSSELSEAVKSAIENEEKLRDKLKRNPDINKDLLDTPERSLSGAEIKQVGETAVKTGDAIETREYREFIELGDECAEAVGATEQTLAADSLLAEARAVWQANQAVTAIRPLADGSIEVELDPAQLSSAVEHLNTADVLGEFQPEFAARSALGNLTLDDALHLETLLPQNSPLTDVLNNQVSNIGNDLMEQFREPINAADQQIMKELTLSAETQNRFAQIRQNEQFLDAMAEQAELAAQNQVPFQGAAQNFTVINPNDAVEAREMNFWAKDRADREAKIAAEQVQSQSMMSAEQRTAEVASEAEVAAEAELTSEVTISVLA